MSTRIDLRNARRNAFRAFRQDGLDRIFGGFALGLMAVFFLDIRHGWVFVIGTTLYTTMPAILRKRLVFPRIGFAKYPPPRRILKGLPTIIVVLICLAVFYVLGKVSEFNWLIPLYVGVTLFVIAFTIARRYGAPADYVLAFLFLCSGFIGLALTASGYEPGLITALQLWTLAAILIFTGGMQFIFFLHKYPMPPEETADGLG